MFPWLLNCPHKFIFLRAVFFLAGELPLLLSNLVSSFLCTGRSIAEKLCTTFYSMFTSKSTCTQVSQYAQIIAQDNASLQVNINKIQTILPQMIIDMNHSLVHGTQATTISQV
jgi:hypothetical protein